MNGKTASLTATYPRVSQGFKLNCDSFTPVANCAAILARGTLVALLTKGIVRLALGLTSNTYISPSLYANCKLIKPLTFNLIDSFSVILIISSIASVVILYGGKTQAESPEWTPASSICCIIAPT